jgi:hypothetical protein
MDVDPRGRARLLEEVLGEGDVGAWTERLRRDCLTRLASQPTGTGRLLRDVIEDPDHAAFQKRLRANLVGRVGRARPRRRLGRAAALLLAMLGASLAGRTLSERAREPDFVGPESRSSRATPPWEVRTRPLARAALVRPSLDLGAEPRAQMDVVGTRPLAPHLVIARDRPSLALVTRRDVLVERVDDAGLFALLPGRPSALVEVGPGTKRLVLLDPADEAALFGPAGGHVPSSRSERERN